MSGKASAPAASATIEVRVELKPGILDAEAENVAKSLALLGVEHLARVETARVYALTFHGLSRTDAEAAARKAVDGLLANPVIHRVTIGPGRR